jgi:hypothetical protein
LDRQVSSVIKYVDAQYADTLNEEIKVVRASTEDQHVHLCIFMIDPSLIMSVRARRERSYLPSKPRSEAIVSGPASSTPGGDTSTDESDDEDEEEEEVFTVSPAEMRAMRRIATRCNVLPVISHADTLTEEKLKQVKDAVKRSMADAGLDFGIFGSNLITSKEVENAPQTLTRSPASLKIHGNGNGANHESDSESMDDEGRQSRPVIKLRPARHASVRNLSRSRSRRDLAALTEELDDSPVKPGAHPRQSVANVRFSAHVLAQMDIESMLPFTFIAPEKGKRPQRRKTVRPISMNSQYTGRSSSRPVSPSTDVERAQMPSLTTPAQSTSCKSSSVSPLPARTESATEPEYLARPPLDPLKGIYVRKYKWGTIDVLDPDHCDFSTLRTLILSTHIKALRSHTRQVLYEKYRMEKLLARRATQQITSEERKQLLEELGL